MKAIKKLTTFICVVTCAVVPFVFAACGDDGNGGNGNAKYTVSEEEWRAALSGELFKNVTVKQSYSGVITEEIQTYSPVYKFDIDNGLIVGSFFSDAYNEEHERVGAVGNILLMLDEQTLTKFVNVGEIGEVYYLNMGGSGRVDGGVWVNADGIEGMANLTVERVYDSLTMAFTKFTEMYSEFSFDSSTHSYIGTLSSKEVTIKFNDKKVESIEFPYNDQSTIIYKFYDYGNTVIDIPIAQQPTK